MRKGHDPSDGADHIARGFDAEPVFKIVGRGALWFGLWGVQENSYEFSWLLSRGLANVQGLFIVVAHDDRT